MPSKILTRLLRGGLAATVVSLAVPALAAADAPDITLATGTVSGTTVTISGSWASDCNTDRAGVGIAIDWNDPNQAGNHVTTLNGVSIDVGTPSDNAVHTTSGGTGTGFTCGTFNGSYNTGSFGGQSHTYSGAIPSSICALAYDVHGKPGQPNGGKETTAGGNGHNGDNSAEKNGQTPAGNVCAEVHVTPPPPPPPPSSGNPAIALTKTGPASAAAGSDVTFTLVVTNPGNQPLSNVTISDPRCDASAPALQSKTGDGTPNTLDPGDTWIYTCTSHTASSDTVLHNVSTTTGTPPSGPPVSATATADVPLLQQGILPLLPGAARLHGPTGCISRARHRVSVTGSRIAKVSFYLDGRYVGTRTRPNHGNRYTLNIRGSKLGRGVHRVRARITFAADTTPQTKVVRLAFARCARSVRPKFTG
jgi:hypothetical protein